MQVLKILDTKTLKNIYFQKIVKFDKANIRSLFKSMFWEISCANQETNLHDE